MTGIYIDDEPIGEVLRLSLKPDDIVLVKVNSRLTDERAAMLHDRLAAIFDGHKVGVVDESLDISVIGAADAAELDGRES